MTDRWALGPSRPFQSTGRHVPSLTEPEQLRGPVEAAFARPGHRGKEAPMTPSTIFVGIDVANARLDLAWRPTGERWTAPNTERGIRAICRRLRTPAPALIVLEATGGLELPLTGALAAAELPVVVVNPRQVRDFAKAIGQLAKTDALDAAVLAQFAEAVRPPVRPLPDAATQALSAL
ncbi:MAG: transposase, partial [Candidatus Methylomirabilis sp.]